MARLSKAPIRLRGALLALLVVGGAVLLVQLLSTSDGSGSSGGPPDDPQIRIQARQYQRQVIYKSPQTPGYTSWVGAWTMPDKSLVVNFTQATGPVDPTKRSLAPRAVLDKLDLRGLDPRGDFWGLNMSVRFLRSTDGGKSWTPFRSDSFKATTPHPYTPPSTIALDDGTLLRRVNGYDIRYDDSVPHTAFLQRLPPGARQWSKPQILLDPARYTYQVSRIRRLRDGRLIALGQVWDVPAGSPPDVLSKARGHLLMMVSDDEAKTWKNALRIPPGTVRAAPGEWDAAELPNGDLLGVMRVRDPDAPDSQIREQGTLVKKDDGWVLTNVQEAPFDHSGHPELLATREGPILHIATTGIDYTSDGGRSWQRLTSSSPAKLRSDYYPRALQLPDGGIRVFSHVGGDDEYGQNDQSIAMQRFRLKVTAGEGSASH